MIGFQCKTEVEFKSIDCIENRVNFGEEKPVGNDYRTVDAVVLKMRFVSNVVLIWNKNRKQFNEMEQQKE